MITVYNSNAYLKAALMKMLVAMLFIVASCHKFQAWKRQSRDAARPLTALNTCENPPQPFETGSGIQEIGNSLMS
jgi:hypothetical protein